MKLKLMCLTVIILSSTVVSAATCSGLAGEYQLTKTIKDKDKKNDCIENLSLDVEGDKLVIMNTHGSFVAEIGNENNSGFSLNMGYNSDWNSYEKFNKCQASSSLNSESTVMFSSVIHTKYLNLKLSKSDKLSLRSSNFVGSSDLHCDYQKVNN